MKPKPSLPLLAIIGASLLAVSSAVSAAVIYEPFAQTAGNLNGAAGGTGLSGNWTASVGTYPVTVTSGTATYGNLDTNGNRLLVGANPGGGQVNSNASIGIGTTLSTAGLMSDTSTLWFSVLYTLPETTSTNSTLSFGIGSAGFATNATLSAGNSAIGFSISRNTRLTAAAWDNGITSGTNANTVISSFTVGSTHLIVGEIIWGASSETINLYLPGSDLTLGTAYSTLTTASNLDQSLFSTLTFGSRNATATPMGLDEIRFGATYASVAPIPEPTTALLGGLGLLALLRRRR